MKRVTISNQSGMSLLEVVIFTSILSLVFVAIVYATTGSIKKTMFNQRKIIATHYAEEVIEWMRGEKETDWSIFSVKSPGTYCMNTSISTCSSDDSCWSANAACDATDYSLNSKYKRSTVLSNDGSRINVTVTVEWKDGSNVFSVPITTTFSRWE